MMCSQKYSSKIIEAYQGYMLRKQDEVFLIQNRASKLVKCCIKLHKLCVFKAVTRQYLKEQ